MLCLRGTTFFMHLPDPRLLASSTEVASRWMAKLPSTRTLHTPPRLHYTREPHIDTVDWLAHPAHTPISRGNWYMPLVQTCQIVTILATERTVRQARLRDKDREGPCQPGSKEKKGGHGPESDSLPLPSPTTYLTFVYFASIPAH